MTKLTTQTKPPVRGKKLEKIKINPKNKGQINENGNQVIEASQLHNMEGAELFPNHAFPPYNFQILPLSPENTTSTDYSHKSTAFHNYMSISPPQANQVISMISSSQIEHETDIPEHVWKFLEIKARQNPYAILNMINTLVPLPELILAVQQTGMDFRTLFIPSSNHSNTNIIYNHDHGENNEE